MRHWSGLTVAMVLGACSNIIGISDYGVDPALDEGGGGTAIDDGGASSSGGKLATGGTSPSGGKASMTEGGAPLGGEATGDGGVVSGGKATTGGTATGGSGSAGAPLAGDGAGGEPNPTGCTGAQDCDDTIDCTTDTCNATGACVHTPKNTLCDATLCEACQAGIGCVAGPKTTMQLLLDPNFDLATGDWVEAGDGTAIVTAAGAQSGTKVAKFGPAAAGAKEQLYGDLLQYMTFPERMVSLSVTGFYKLTPGTKLPADDYAVLALYEDGEIDPFSQFHSFEATAGAQAAWKAFSYNIPKSEVTVLAGTDQIYTFDLVAHVWDSVFQFDSLQLNAAVCQ